MKKTIFAFCATMILAIAFSVAAMAAHTGSGRSYNVSCYKTFGVYQYAKATHSASCSEGHNVTLKTKLTVRYTNGTSASYSGGKKKKKQVPDGKVGKSASGVFNATCSGGYKFPKRTAGDSW